MIDPQEEYSQRRYLIVTFVVLLIGYFLWQLSNLQLFPTDYESRSNENAVFKDIWYPARGVLFDRKGNILVDNQPSYDLMVIFKNLPPFDTLDLCRCLDIKKEVLQNRLKNIQNRKQNPHYSPYIPQIVVSKISPSECALLQERIYRFPGFYIRKRTERQYVTPYASLALGSIGEVSKEDLKDSYYEQGDYIGRLGVEEFYEKFLRGQKGYKKYLKDAYGRIIGSYKNGEEDNSPTEGKNLHLTLDMDLQAYGEKLMEKKIGAIIAIEPQTGEVLAMVASPTYDPTLLVGMQRGRNYTNLLKDENKPLYNRSIMATYPPGSTFKIAQGLILQQEGFVSKTTTYECSEGFTYGEFHMGCHKHFSPLNFIQSIAHSCNAYYCQALRDMLWNKRKYHSFKKALNHWKELMMRQGFGNKLGIDLPNERAGFIPGSDFYDNLYQGKWNPYSVLCIAIGQGEVITTPLQIANLAATVANRGWYIPPHLIKSIEGDEIDSFYTTRKYTGIDSEYYEIEAEGMRQAVDNGTVRIGRIPKISMAGKTGTAQNPHGNDHSICMAFAPVDSPKIAIAVYIENAGFGATYAVPMASLMIEKYINGKIRSSRLWMEERLFKTSITPQGITSTFSFPKVEKPKSEENIKEIVKEEEKTPPNKNQTNRNEK